jgi:hypothetical protein
MLIRRREKEERGNIFQKFPLAKGGIVWYAIAWKEIGDRAYNKKPKNCKQEGNKRKCFRF